MIVTLQLDISCKRIKAAAPTYIIDSEVEYMQIIRAKESKAVKQSGGIFIGTVERTPLIDQSMGSKEFLAAIISFPPGTRNRFHTHDHEQILYITDGRGIVATEEEETVVNAGDIILIPAGENHWHGATMDSSMTHLFVVRAENRTSF